MSLLTGRQRSILWSARILAGFRAYESKNPNNPLISDPYAELLAAMKAKHTSIDYSQFQDEDNERKERPIHLIRTKAIDGIIQSSIEQWATNHTHNSNDSNDNKTDSLGQLVLLGSGLDSRAYRLNCLSNIKVFEIDYPTMLQYKEEKLKQYKPLCFNQTVHYISSSLVSSHSSTHTNNKPQFPSYGSIDPQVSRREWRVKRAKFMQQQREENPISSEVKEAESSCDWADLLLLRGFDSSLPTLFVAEGVLMYLTAPQVSSILSRCSSLSQHASSQFIADFVNNACLASGLSWYRLFKSSADDNQEIIQVFAQHHWLSTHKQIKRIGPGQNEINYGRFKGPHMTWKNEKTGESDELYAFIVTASKS
jgi:O-methyltransferase involved in polyketide biosynthesis